jgi:hypothetical protein
MNLNDYDKFVRRFVKDYVNNLTPNQMRNLLTEQFHIDIENIRQDTDIDSALEEMKNWEQDLYFHCWEKTFQIKENKK